ncbi:fumarylacetoacetate hydrolase family protein [Pseudonocardia acaciae]|uniref:fumarylacetoacetate hydrolase family protein n=1 Tax=Pseudonocardia acaciae TaxID=551276 RepID=UPI0005693618|nr:fumarylacetoacetate hydrolase family protein [Pseudonocardia acaciae]
MRFAVFGQDRLGLVQGEEIVDVTASVPGPASPAGVLHRLIEAGDVPMPTDAVATHALSSVRLAAPLPRPPKIIAAPVNYRDHQAEMAAAHTIADLGVFLKAPSSVIGHGATVRLPYGDVRTDQEGELAVVIGRTARHVPVDRALEFVFGYCCALDITVRSTEDRSTRKSFDTFTPLGPWVVTADEVPDPRELTLRCWVDGELRQSARVDELIFGVAELIAYASSVMTLWPGDVLLTGTPAGVGPINDASSVAVQVDPIGRLEVLVSSESAVPYAARPRPEARS